MRISDKSTAGLLSSNTKQCLKNPRVAQLGPSQAHTQVTGSVPARCGWEATN